MQEGHRKYLVAFSRLAGIGPVRFNKISKFFPDLATAWTADYSTLKRSGLEEKIVEEIITQRKKIDPDAEYEKIIQAGINIISQHDTIYPRALREIYPAPAFLYYRGQLKILNKICLAIVGARKYSEYGQRVTEKIIADIAPHNLTIVSGLALGIDGLAHEATLKHNGLAAAVLGSGLNWPNIYPVTNQQLAEKIISSGGLLLSEYPPDTPGFKSNFPQRNRIIAGLSQATLIIEAKASSGSLITAKYALDYNRDVWAIPGNIDRLNSEGTNNLIKLGAKLITSGQDIIEELKLPELPQCPPSQKLVLTELEKNVLTLIDREAVHIDKIAQLSKLKINALSELITILEIKGLIKDLGGKNYISLIK